MMLNPRESELLADFQEKVRPFMDRWGQLPPAEQSGFVESVIGAYLNESEQRLGDLQKASDRAIGMVQAMLSRQELTVYRRKVRGGSHER